MALLFESYLRRAQLCKKDRQWREAQRAVEAALYVLPTSKEAITCQVEIYYGLRDWSKAQHTLEQALSHYPYWPWAILELVDLMVYRLQSAPEAWRWLQRLKMCHPLTEQEQVRGASLKAAALVLQERWYEASRSLRDSLRFFPRDPQLLFLRGWVALQRDNYYGAVAALKPLLKQDPEYADAHYYLALAYQGMEEWALMKEQFRWTYALDCEESSSLQVSPRDFRVMVDDVLSELGLYSQQTSISWAVQEFPLPWILDKFPHNPRCSGVFLSHPRPSLTSCETTGLPTGTLYFFQRNVERFCSSLEEIRREICHVSVRELATYLGWPVDSDLESAQNLNMNAV